MSSNFRENARDLASVIINRWEKSKDFNELILVIEEFLIDQDSEYDSRLATLQNQLDDLKERIKCLSI